MGGWACMDKHTSPRRTHCCASLRQSHLLVLLGSPCHKWWHRCRSQNLQSHGLGSALRQAQAQGRPVACHDALCACDLHPCMLQFIVRGWTCCSTFCGAASTSLGHSLQACADLHPSALQMWCLGRYVKDKIVLQMHVRAPGHASRCTLADHCDELQMGCLGALEVQIHHPQLFEACLLTQRLMGCRSSAWGRISCPVSLQLWRCSCMPTAMPRIWLMWPT